MIEFPDIESHLCGKTPDDHMEGRFKSQNFTKLSICTHYFLDQDTHYTSPFDIYFMHWLIFNDTKKTKTYSSTTAMLFLAFFVDNTYLKHTRTNQCCPEYDNAVACLCHEIHSYHPDGFQQYIKEFIDHTFLPLI